jgi:hypothetical protein
MLNEFDKQYIKELEEKCLAMEEKLAEYDRRGADQLFRTFEYFLNWNLLNMASIKIDTNTMEYSVKINSNLHIDKDSEHYQFIDNFYNNILKKKKPTK